VIVADIRADAAESVMAESVTQKGMAHALQIDITNEQQVIESFAQVVQEHGRLDILVNNAGVGLVGTLVETSSEDWDRVMAVNAKGTFLCSKYAVQLMIGQNPPGGVLVNIASVAGQIAVDRRFAYGASKGAILSMTRSIAIDFVSQGIRANAISPGTIHTSFVEGYLERSFAANKDEVRQQLHARQPLGRMGRPDEIAYAALYLASDEAAFVTGSTLVIDGGWTAK
jgi:NAD(P)-dependent dehydrogenase (short-subunit alcohol dehydrogenase family)